MIPKIIHYCWFGKNEKSEKAKSCIASWKKMCPEYEIIEWNEDNFDVFQNAYTTYTYVKKKYAFLSDYARLVIIEQYGGIYFDTDVELIRNLDELLGEEAFYGFENDQYVATGLGFGAEAHHKTVQNMLKEYDELQANGMGDYPTINCPKLNTKALVQLGLVPNGKKQKVDGAVIYPVEIFNPYDDPTGRLQKTKDTISIHWYAKSWLDKKTILRSNLTRPFHRVFGKECFKKWKKKQI